jgi:hypothetical protein
MNEQSAKQFNKYIYESWRLLNMTNQRYVNEVSSNESWEAPIDLFTRTVKSFPVDIFPEWLKQQVNNVIQFTQTSSDAAGMAALSVLSTALAKKFVIKPSNDGSWVEKINLYTVATMRSGERKSTVHDLFIKPIVAFERNARERRKEELMETATNVRGPKAITRLPRYMCDDVTPERMVGLLTENEERIAILSDDGGGIFQTLNGRYSNDPNIDVFLKGFTGNPIIVERIGRESETVYDPSITIGVFVQPTVLQDQPERLIERGVFGRFLYALPEPRQQPRDVTPRKIDEQIEQTYQLNIHRMMEFRPDNPITLILNTEAESEFLKYCAQHEEKLLNDLDYIHMSSWAERLPGQLLRITALLHVADQISARDNLSEIDPNIGLELISKVISLADYLIEHAKKAFGCLRSDGELEDAKYLWNVLEQSPDDQLKKQEIWRRTKGKLTKAEYLDDALRILVQHRYIELVLDDDSSKRGRTGLLIVRNPRAINQPNDPGSKGNLPLVLKPKRKLKAPKEIVKG